jgi:alpha-L-fucosidase
VHVLAWPKDDSPLQLPPITRKVVGSRMLTGGSAQVSQTDEGITVSLPSAYRHEINTVIVLELDGPAADIPPVAAQTDLISEGKPARASNVYQGLAEFSANKAVDGDPESRWATDAGTESAWLEVEFESVQVVGSALICEAFPGRIQEFALEYRVEGEWKPFYRGKQIGENAKFEFEPVTIRKVRLNILRATDGPSLWEFQLCAPESGKTRP